jgi:hypothetical protein
MTLLTNEQKVKLTLAPKTQLGNPAPIDGVPTWSVSDENIVTLDIAPDGLSAYVLSNQVGLSQVNVVADADLGAGVREIASAIDFQVVNAEAFSLGLTTGDIELK